jgi:hypothetical protein
MSTYTNAILLRSASRSCRAAFVILPDVRAPPLLLLLLLSLVLLPLLPMPLLPLLVVA